MWMRGFIQFKTIIKENDTMANDIKRDDLSDYETMRSNFIHEIIDKDLEEGVHKHVHTRFPPEPNGYLHIGHAKSICLNFGTALKYKGLCNLRFDDTNPVKEDVEYINSIIEDVKWLGFDWEDRLFYASDYFEKMYEYAVMLIEMGKAYVDDLTAEEIKNYRGTLTEPGKDSPYRNRTIEENLDLFKRMRAGEFEDGSRVLRAKIDMASPNLNMRDPVIYRIAHASHHRTGDKWCIYPMYDYAHPISDALEGITHSILLPGHGLFDLFPMEIQICHRFIPKRDDGYFLFKLGNNRDVIFLDHSYFYIINHIINHFQCFFWIKRGSHPLY
jgi:glutaminyl-tRNA synthetase